MTGQCCAILRTGNQCSNNAREAIYQNQVITNVCGTHWNLYLEICHYENMQVAMDRIITGRSLNLKETAKGFSESADTTITEQETNGTEPP